MFGYLSILLGGYLYTQRNPDRIPDFPYGALSPADGKVISIDNNNVKIFLDIMDIHHQKAPLSGIVKEVNLYNGNTNFCNKLIGCSENNKYILTIMETEYGLVEIVQKAGGLFSKPISFLNVGQYIERGQTIGKITFGSGCYISIPSNLTISVQKGQKVYAGKTIIAM